MEYVWDEAKRRSNLRKHGLDFSDADWVLGSPLRMEIESIRNGQRRTQAFAYVFGFLAVLTVVYVSDGAVARIISFRGMPAAMKEMTTMPKSEKLTRMTLEQMRAARAAGKSLTDWERVRRAIERDDPVEYDPETDLCDPNDAEAVHKLFATARRPGQRGPQKTPVKERVNIRLEPEILAAFRASGPKWQTRINAALMDWLKTHSPGDGV